MRGFWKMRRDEDELEARLRDARPEPSREFVDAVVRRMEHGRRSRLVGVRIGLAAASTALAVAAVASFGGVGYAATAIDEARSAVKQAVTPSKKADKDKAKHNKARGGAATSPSNDQYGHDRVTICHRTPSGNEKTLVLPRPAANAHLRNHEDDTLGPC